MEGENRAKKSRVKRKIETVGERKERKVRIGIQNRRENGGGGNEMWQERFERLIYIKNKWGEKKKEK